MAEEDLPGFLLNGGSGEHFHYLMMPAILDSETGSQKWYDAQRYTHAIPILYDMKVPKGEERALWPLRYPLTKLKQLEKGDIYTFSSQYMGAPTPAGGSVFKNDWWQYYDELPHQDMKYLRIYADTAHKTGEHNDFSVFECWGLGNNGNIYLVDLIRGKWEAPELKKQFEMFYKKWKKPNQFVPYRLNCAKIEDKASGIGLIQELKKTPGTIIVPIPRSRDKVTRAMGVAPAVQAGRVLLPKGAPWLDQFLIEADSFSPTMGHKHDDQLDCMFDAVEDMIINGVPMWTNDMIGDVNANAWILE